MVSFEILISEEGSVPSARLLNGHPLLVAPATEAIMRWRYAPPRFEGESVEVITTAAVTFTLRTAPSPTNGPTVNAI
jgi:outer membrane biosynthesis protein TonB